MKRQQPKRYTFLFRTTPNTVRLQKCGAQIVYVGQHSRSITAIISSSNQLKTIVRDPNILVFDRDRKVSLPFPKVESIVPTGRLVTKQQSNKSTLPWNLARVLRGRYPRAGGGAGVKVGIVDTGIDLNHPDLKANIKGGINVIQPSSTPQDHFGHGTHVAGVIGARRNSKTGVTGIAPSVSLYAIKVLNGRGHGTLMTLIKGIEWGITNGMHILNISISAGQSTPPILKKLIQIAVQRGILVIAASGNTGRTSGIGNNVQVPARIPGAVAVGAVDQRNRRAPFSSTGPSLAIAAPGVNILSTYSNNRYAVLSGTSMAAPHVSGIAALLKHAHPYASPGAIMQTLYRHAIDLPPRGKDWLTGAGLVQRP